MSEALVQAWKEAKNIGSTVKMCVVGKETFVVDTCTGKVAGKTYNSRNVLKDNINASWDGQKKEWTVDTDKFNTELISYPDYYKKYIVAQTDASIASRLFAFPKNSPLHETVLTSVPLGIFTSPLPIIEKL